MEKEHCTKFCGDLVRFHEVTELQSFVFGACEAIPTNA